jgi:hypothetical protein
MIGDEDSDEEDEAEAHHECQFVISSHMSSASLLSGWSLSSHRCHELLRRGSGMAPSDLTGSAAYRGDPKLG